MKKTSLYPSSPTAKRFAAIMHRASTTAWNEKKEIRHFRELSPHVQEDDLQMVERYYKSNWPPKTSKNHLRHDLATLINNWHGEVDRARIWCESHPLKTERKIIQMPPAKSEPYIAPTDPESIATLARFEEERQRRKAAK